MLKCCKVLTRLVLVTSPRSPDAAFLLRVHGRAQRAAPVSSELWHVGQRPVGAETGRGVRVCQNLGES